MKMTVKLEDVFAEELWAVYDNATDQPIAYGTARKIIARQLKMKVADFEALLAEYRKGKRIFRVLGKKRSLNIILNGYNASRAA